VNISPTSLDFGNQLIGSGSSLPVLLSNPTKKPVSIASIITTGNFSVAASPCGLTLAAGGQCTFYVVFSPAAAGAQTGMLSVNDDANNTPQKVKLSGAGVAAPPVLVSISVAPASATLKKGAWLQLTATGTYSDHSTSNLTVASQWSSLSPAVATVGSSGLRGRARNRNNSRVVRERERFLYDYGAATGPRHGNDRTRKLFSFPRHATTV
jgi:hypothetical protein